jgi:hypothetical protein
MKKNNILVFEPNMNSYPHSEVNAGILSLLELVYDNQNFIFIANNNHFDAIQNIRKFEKWQYLSTKVFPYEPKYFLINDFRLILKILRIFLVTKKEDTIYLLGIMPLSNIFISFLNLFFKKNVFIFLHGQMEAYLPDTKIGLSKYYYRISKFVFKINDNINYLFFGESIKNNLKFLFNLNKKLIVIDQPYLFQELEGNLVSTNAKAFTLGIIGRFDYSKNVKEFFILIDSFEKEILDKKIIIKIVGKVNYEIPKKYLQLISFYNRELTITEFKDEIQQLDFVISFTDESYYRATPSGVLFDCIKWEKPILGLNNEFINYYFTKHGKIGEIFNNTFEMIDFLKINFNTQNLSFSQYPNYIENLKKLKQFLSIKNLSEKFAKQI